MQTKHQMKSEIWKMLCQMLCTTHILGSDRYVLSSTPLTKNCIKPIDGIQSGDKLGENTIFLKKLSNIYNQLIARLWMVMFLWTSIFLWHSYQYVAKNMNAESISQKSSWIIIKYACRITVPCSLINQDKFLTKNMILNWIFIKLSKLVKYQSCRFLLMISLLIVSW